MSFFPLIELQGTSAERGCRHGIGLKTEITEEIALQTAGTVPADKKAYADEMERYLAQFFPDLLEEWRGIAKGAGVSYEQILALNVSNSYGPLASACTAVAWRAPDADGMARLFKTDDGPGKSPHEEIETTIRLRLASTVVFHVRSPSTDYLGIGRAGRLWIEAGINEHGLGLGCSSGRPAFGGQNGKGVAQHLFPTLVLRNCRTVNDAIEFARLHPVAGKGINLVVADRNGQVAAIEKCATEVGVRREGPFEFTVNHYQDRCMGERSRLEAPDFFDSPYYKNSYSRECFLKAQRSKILEMASDLPAQLDLLLANGTGQLCQTFEEDEGLWTNYSTLLDPAKRTMEIFCGPFSRTPHCSYTLGKRL